MLLSFSSFAFARKLLALVAALLCTASAQAQFSVTTPTTFWNTVPYPETTRTDFGNDQQTGSTEGDIVGNNILPSFYTKYVPAVGATPATVYYRVRLGSDASPAGFKAACFLGIDGNGDGVLDFFLGVNNSGSANGIYIWGAGTGLNISPSTTSIDSQNPFRSYGLTALNYNWSIVNSTIDPEADTPAELDTNSDGSTDYFLTFSLPFSDIQAAFQSIGITLTTNTVLTYVMGTATQVNSFNQDINGVPKNYDGSASWSSLGVLTQPITINGTVANEPPVNTVPAAQNVRANFTVSISGISVSDFDGNLATVQLTVTQGSVLVSLAGGATISAGANGTSTLTLSGTQAQINAALGTLSYAPASGYSGGDSLTVLSTDSASATDSDTIAITVVPNRAPVAVNDTPSTQEDTAVTFPVLTNDSDPDGDPLTVTGATMSNPSQGSVVLNGNGTLSFTPAANFNGSAVINYTITDGQGGTASATATVNVSGVNDAPVANNDSATTNEDTAVTRMVTSNDTDVDGDSLTVTGATLTSGQGSVAFSGGNVTFTPALNFNGTATISYTISDGNGGVGFAVLTVTVTGVNDAPIAANDAATTNEDTAVAVPVLANDSDVDGDALTITSATLTSGSGNVAISGSTVIFTPALNFNGTATFSYAISDGNGGTATANGTVTVNALNDAPLAADDSVATNEDAAVTVPVLSNDTDVDGDTLVVTGATLMSGQGAVSHTGSGVTFTPAVNFNGTATITYTISDGNGGTDSAVLTVTVAPVNDAPVALDDSASTGENTAVTFAVLSNDFDVDGDTLVVSGATVPAAQGTVTVNANGTLQFTPANGFVGLATITYSISDGNGGTASAAARVNVLQGNRPPVARDDLATTAEDTAVTIPALANDSDPDGDALNITGATVAASAGTVIVQGGELLFTPAANFHGTATITYTISDGGGGTASATATVSVSSVNDGPIANNDAASTNEDAAVTAAVTSNDSDLDGDTLTVASATLTSGEGSVTFSGGNVTFTPAANFNGTATIGYTISDGNGGSASAILTVTVAAVNDAPVAVNDSATTDEDTAVTVPVLANDSDVDGDTLAITSASLTSGSGTVAISGSAVVFTPARNFSGAASFSYTISDGNGGTATASGTITVVAVNDAPVAAADAAITNEDTAVAVAVLTNDTDADGDNLTITDAVLTSGQGSVAHSGNSITFTPAANFNGSATITYTISDGNGGTDSAVLAVTITAVNDAPLAVDDSATTDEDTAIPVPVLANDTDPEGDPLTITSAALTSGSGSVAISGSSVVFAPAANFSGAASFSYTISDGNGGMATASGTVTVLAMNDAPVAANDAATTNEDTAVTVPVLANDSDVDGDALTITSTAMTTGSGSVTISGSTVLFTPAPNFNGAASFSYTISDGNGGTASANGTVTVLPVNDAPVAANDAATTNEDTAVPVLVLANDADADGDTLTITSATLTTGQGNVVQSGDNVTFTPAANFNGSATITYTISDGNGGTDSAVLTVTILAVNDAPVAANDSATTNEDTAVAVSVLANDNDVDGDALAITTATLTSGSGSVTISGSTVVFTPAVNFNGAAAFSYTISDGNGGTATANGTVTVVAVNDAPVAANDSATTNEDAAVAVPVLANDTDVDGDALAITAATLTSGSGSVTISGSTVVFTPAPNFSGAAAFSYTINDGNGGTATASGTVTVLPVNDAPVAANDATTTNEDTVVTVPVLANDTDVDGDTLTVTSATLTSGQGTIAHNGAVVTFTPAANFNGSATISYTISDGNGGTDSAVLTITITAVNDAPVAADDSATTNEDTAVAMPVLANDTDVDGDALAITSAALTSGSGSVAISGSTVVFTPAPDFNGAAAFSYTISDGHGGTATASGTVTVLPVNDAPVAANDSATTNEDTAVTVPVLANDTDADGDTLTITSATLVSGQGTVSQNGTGVTFTPATDFNGSATITYTIFDGNGGIASAVLTVTILAVNDTPVALDDSASTPTNTAVTFAVLPNDFDVDGDTLTVTGATVAAVQGTVAVTAGGTLQFTPASGFNGLATITYTISDGNGGTASAVARVNVLAPGNTPPVAQNDSATTPEDTAVTIPVLANDSDPEGDALTITSATVVSSAGAVTVQGDVLLFTPAPNFNGAATITYTIDDGRGGTASATATVAVRPVNDLPIANNDSATTPEDTAVATTVTSNDSDVDGDTLIVTSATLTGGQGSVSHSDGTVTFTPAVNFNGVATISYTISDGNGGTASAVLTVTVIAVNDSPTAASDSATTNEDTAVSVAVLENDTDPDGDTLLVVSAALTSGEGTIAYTGTSVTFTPALNFNGPATFTYTITDGNGGTASTTGAITVIAVNDPPIAQPDATTTPEDTAVSIPVLANDSDVDGDALVITGASVPAAQGAVTITGGALQFRPAGDFEGIATITYAISDGNGGTASSTATVNVGGTNDAPIAQNDTAATAEDTAVTIAVLANDSDVDGDPLTVTSAAVAPGQGTVTINADGTLRFIPELDFTGPATISYSISDGNGGTASAVATVNVTPVNDAPTPTNDSATTPAGRPIVIAVLANDSDPEGNPLTVTAATVVDGRGTAVVNPDGTLEFTPAPAFSGPASIVYTVSDGHGGTARATVSILVDALPIAIADSASTTPGTARLIPALLNDADPEGLPLTIIDAAILPSQGTLTITLDGQLLYTPAAGVVGTVTGSYTIRDEAGNIASANVMITIAQAPAAQPPLARSDFASTVQQAAVTIPVLQNDSDSAGGTLTIIAANVAAAEGTVMINPNGTLTFSAAAGFEGNATITYTVQNVAGATSSAPAVVRVAGGNAPPLAQPDSATAASGVPKVLRLLRNDSDPDGDTLSIVSVTVSPTQGTVQLNPDGTVTFTPTAGFTGTAVIAYEITDGNGGTSSSTASVAVSAAPVNAAPIAANDAAATPVDQLIDVPVLINDRDPDGDLLTVTSVTVPAGQGTATVNPDGTIRFTPTAGLNEAVVLTYTISDSQGGTDSAFVTINVNDNPIATTDRANTLPRVPVTIAVLENDSDPNGNTIILTAASSDPAEGTLIINSDGTIRFTPAAGFAGTAEVSYTITDAHGGYAEGTVYISVNTPPTPVDDTASTPLDQSVTIVVLANDTDPDGDPLTVVGGTVDPVQGTVIINPDGTLTFTPAATFTGPAIITYTVTDPDGTQTTATVTVTRGNIAPEADDRTVYTYCKTAVRINPLRTASDRDGDPLTIVAVSQPQHGRVIIKPDGTVLYRPHINIRKTTTDTFTITLSDGKGGTTVETITVRAFAAIAGTFQGLVDDTTGTGATAIPGDARGRLTVTLTNRANFTAKLELDDAVFRFTGTLTGPLTYQRKLLVDGEKAMLTLKYDDLADRWSATLSSASISVQDISGILRKTTHAPAAALYEMQLAPSDPTEPAGAALLRVRSSGAVSMAGQLPDGTPFSSSSWITASGLASAYDWVSRRAGSVAGEMNVPAATAPTGTLIWRDARSGTTEALELREAR